MSNINERIAYLLERLSDNKPTRFGELIGSTPQYIKKITTPGGSVGLEPVSKILRAVPDLNARWLILGEGDPFDRKIQENGIRSEIGRRVKILTILDKILPEMSLEELDQVEKSITGGLIPEISPSRLVELAESLRREEAEAYNTLYKEIEEADDDRRD